MTPDSEFTSVKQVAPTMSRDGKLRLVLQRLASGYYQRPDVLGEVAERIRRTS